MGTHFTYQKSFQFNLFLAFSGEKQKTHYEKIRRGSR